MTAICAYKSKDGIWIGSDSMGVSGDYICTNSYPKIISIGDYQVAYTYSYRTADLIEINKEKFPQSLKDKHDVIKFGDILREILIEEGGAKSEASEERTTITHPVSLIFATKTRIFVMESNYSVFEHKDYAVHGSGRELLAGALSVCKDLGITNGRIALNVALKAAIKHVTTVNGKICIRKL